MLKTDVGPGSWCQWDKERGELHLENVSEPVERSAKGRWHRTVPQSLMRFGDTFSEENLNCDC